jgi:hypothetical protein
LRGLDHLQNRLSVAERLGVCANQLQHLLSRDHELFRSWTDGL